MKKRSPNVSLGQESIIKDFHLPTIVHAMSENMHFFMTVFLRFAPVFETLPEAHDASIFFSNIPDNTFNYVLRARFENENVLTRIQEITRFYQEKQLPFSWYVTALDTPVDLPQILQEGGLEKIEENVVMVLDLRHQQIQTETSLEFKRVQSHEELQAFDEVNYAGGEIRHYEALYKHIPLSCLRGEFPVEFYIGYLEGKPVTTGIVVFFAGVAGIYYVATLPTERRKGFAKAMMQHLFLQCQKKGYPFVTLQATADGKYLYEKLGFQECSRAWEFGG